MDGWMVLDWRHTTLASRDHGGTGPSSAGPSLEPQTGPPLRGAPIKKTRTFWRGGPAERLSDGPVYDPRNRV